MSAPFWLTTLGALDLRHDDRGQVSTLLAQPKRMGLLVYLALNGRDRFCSRDSLLALFWPESDEQKARASLRQALQFLRRALGEAAVLARGDDAVGIDSAVVACDARDFLTALDTGDAVSALRAYRGPLLPGFVLDEAPAFDLWMSSERERLRRLALQAARTATAGAASPAEALEFAQRAVEVAPEDEPAARQLATLHDQLGNRGAALTEIERLRRWLQHELAVDPSPETLALEASLRAPVPAALTVTAPAPPSPPTPAAPAQTPRAPATATVRSGANRRPITYGTAALTMAAAALAARAWGPWGASGTAPNGSPRTTAPAPRAAVPRIAVVPFVDRTGDPRLAAVGSMVADWITGGLSAVDGLTVVPLTAVASSARALAGDTISSERIARRIAADVGATVLVRGVAYRTNRIVHLQAQLTNAADGALLRPVETVSVPEDSVMTGIDRLRARVVAALVPLSDTVTHLRQAVPPPSLEAYRAYVRALEAFVQGDLEGALTLFDAAARDDSTYAMPRIAASIALLNLRRADEADALLRTVSGRRPTLGPLERATYDMVEGMLAGNLAAVDRAVREQARIAPGTIGEYMVAEVARRRGRPAEALAVLRALGPDRGELRGWRAYWRELTGALHMRGEYAAEAAAARAALTRYADEASFHSYLVRALAALGDTVGVTRAIQQRASDAGILWHVAANEATQHADTAVRAWARSARHREGAWHAAQTGRDRTVAVRWRHARALALNAHPGAARDSLTALARVTPESVPLLGLRGAVAAMLGEREAVARAIAALDAVQQQRTPVSRVVAEGDVDYWLAVIAAQQQDADGATTALRRAFGGWRGRDVAIGSDPWFTPVRRTPVFAALLRLDEPE